MRSVIVSRRQGQRHSQRGMTLVEMVIALGMLVIFTATVASVLSFTQRYLRQTETVAGSDTLLADIGSKGLLIDQHELQLAMDALVEQLQQPAWQAEDILQITADPDRRCSYNPVVSWGLMGKTLLLPPRYRICLRASSLTEPVDVVSNGIVTQSAADQLEDGAPPGIYILQALPDQLDASTLPARRIFCRPRPYC